MNRRSKAPTKKIEFEPKVPLNQPQIPQKSVEEQNIIKERPAEEKEIVNMMRGLLAPKSFSNAKTFDINSHGFIMQIPNSLTDASVVVFDDGSLGIKKDGVVYECDCSHMGDSIAVEFSEKSRKAGDVDFILTGYECVKNCDID